MLVHVNPSYTRYYIQVSANVINLGFNETNSHIQRRSTTEIENIINQIGHWISASQSKTIPELISVITDKAAEVNALEENQILTNMDFVVGINDEKLSTDEITRIGRATVGVLTTDPDQISSIVDTINVSTQYLAEFILP